MEIEQVRCRSITTRFNIDGVPEKFRCVKPRGHTGKHEFEIGKNYWQDFARKVLHFITQKKGKRVTA